jgi:hypothetical protein
VRSASPARRHQCRFVDSQIVHAPLALDQPANFGALLPSRPAW